MTQTIRIHREAPPKPVFGAGCNGCGVCCAAEPCPLGVLVTGRLSGRCSALAWDDAAKHYRCRLVQVRSPVLAGLARRLISASSGCDSDADMTG